MSLGGLRPGSGRKPFMTPAIKQHALALYARGYSDGQVADELGCSARTVLRERRRDPAFGEAVARVRHHGPWPHRSPQRSPTRRPQRRPPPLVVEISATEAWAAYERENARARRAS